MTIFRRSRLSNTRGQILIYALGFSFFSALTAGSLLMLSNRFAESELENAKDTITLMTAHSFSSLIKMDLQSNYGYAQQAFPSCVTSVDSYIQYIQTPSTCGTANFEYLYMYPTGSAQPTFGQQAKGIAMAQFMTSQWNSIGPINGYQVQFQPSQLIVDNLLGTLTLIDINRCADPNDSTLKTCQRQTMETSINLTRTLSAASRDPSAHLCRPLPGRVCTSGSTQLSCMDFSGQIWNIDWDATTNALSWTLNTSVKPGPRAVSAKVQTANYIYYADSFCLPIQKTPVLYVIDAATVLLDQYFLTVHGYIWRFSGKSKNPKLVAYDPKLTSIAYDPNNATWYFLRMDGQVMQMMGALDNPNQYKPQAIDGMVLPRCQVLSFGTAPAPANNSTCP